MKVSSAYISKYDSISEKNIAIFMISNEKG